MPSQNDSNLLLETSFHDSFLYVVAAIVSMMAGAVLATAQNRIGWALSLVVTASFIFLLCRRLSRSSTLLLTPGGFTYQSSWNTFSYRWSDVEKFCLGGNIISRTVEFSIHSSSRAQNEKVAYRLESAFRREISIPENYGIGASELCALLNEWRVRHTERNYRATKRI